MNEYLKIPEHIKALPLPEGWRWEDETSRQYPTLYGDKFNGEEIAGFYKPNPKRAIWLPANKEMYVKSDEEGLMWLWSMAMLGETK